MIMAKDSNNNYVKIEDIKQQNSFNGVSPIKFKGSGENLENYRIYGNTIGGESVGDRTANLFDGNFLQGYWAYADGRFTYTNTWICTTKIPCTGSRVYTYSFSNLSRWTGFVWYDADGEYISTSNQQNSSDIPYRLYYAEAPSNAEFMVVNIAGYPSVGATIFPADVTDFMLVEGSTALPYEPYGYKVPVTVSNGTDTQTIQIYLPEQIRKVGDEAEYVDYKEQKQHRVRKNLLPNADWVEGYITVAGDIAQPSPSKQEITSPFVKVIPGKTYVFSYYPNEGEPWRAVIYYTEDKRFIKQQSAAYSPSSVAFTVESGVGYVRFSYRSYGDGTFSQLELGDTVTDYEPYIEDTELDVTLPALLTLSGTNTLSVGTEIKPSKVWGRLSDPRDIEYVKDNLGNILFSKYHEVEDEPPLTFKAKKEGALKDYRIYGNTVNGESVGDRTANLFDNDINKIPTTVYNVSELYVDKNDTVVVATGYDMYVGNVHYTNTSYSTIMGFKYPCTVGKYYCVYDSNAVFNKNFITFFNANNKVVNHYNCSTAGVIAPNNSTYFTIRFGKEATISGQTYRGKLMVVESNTSSLPDTYEPYGYRVPVTVTNGTDTETTNLYLPEQIKMVGDEAEYIDYGEQKQHRVRKNLLPNEATNRTINGVAFTVNNDGSITCNGTASNIVFYGISSEAFSLPVGRYKLNGAPTGGGQNYNYKLDVRVSTDRYYPDTGNGGYFSILQGEPITLSRIVIYSGYTCDNLTFYPMIRKADIADNTYEPYIADTELDVTLPALPTLSGTNALSVGTEVQPSEVYIKGKIKEIN